MVILTPVRTDLSIGEVEKFLFLCFAVLLLGRFVVPLDHGYLRLTTLGTQAAAMSLRPGLALVVALVAALPLVPHLPKGKRISSLGIRLLWVTVPSTTAYFCRTTFPWGSWASPIIVIVGMTGLNWLLTLANLRFMTGHGVQEVTAGTFSRSFLAAFLYFGFASFLMASVLDGSLHGYFLASIVAFLSITLTEKMNQQRKRQIAEAQLVDVHRHIAYQRAVAGLVHNLRNTLSVTKSYLEDFEELRGTDQAAARIAGAKRAADEALSNLARWSQAANPSLEVAAEEFELSSIAEERVDAARRLAAHHHIEIEIRRESLSCAVKADPVQIGDVVTNLLLNSIDAIDNRGRIVVTIGRDRRGFAMLSVADSGPGVPPGERDHLFEPNFTTKAGGTGIGLFSSFGIVRQHGGELRYESGPPGGAVFTILLPALLPTAPEAIAEPGDSLDPTSVPEGLSRGVDRLVD